MIDAVLGFFAGLGVLFVLGSFSFWVVLAVMFGALVWITEEHRDFLAAIVLGVFILVVASVNDWSIALNPLSWAKYLALYLALGAAYSFLKWLSFLFKRRDELKQLKADFAEKTQTELENGKVPDKHFGEFANYIQDLNHRHGGLLKKPKKPTDLIPTVKDNVGSLTRWIVWWPFSAFWTFLNDPLTRLARLFVQTFRGIYDKIARGVFANEI